MIRIFSRQSESSFPRKRESGSPIDARVGGTERAVARRLAAPESTIRRLVGLLLAAIFPLLKAAVFLGLIPVGQVMAQADPPFSIQGFGTLGATRTSSNEVEYVRDLSQPRGADRRWDHRVDSLLALQGNWQFAPNWMAVIQGVTHYRYDKTYIPEITWFFFKFDPLPNLSLRAGRLGTEFFMNADSRQIGYSFLTARPPADYFWYLPFSSIDGADAAFSLPIGEHLLRTKVFYGVSDNALPLADQLWKLDGSKMLGAYLEYAFGAWVLRTSYANIRFARDLPIADSIRAALPAAMAEQTLAHVSTGNTRSHYYSIGLIYDRGPWQWQLMLNHIVQGSQAFESSNSGYVLGGYRVASVTPYLGYSWVRSDARGSAPNPVAASIMADAHSDQRTAIVGARWDFARSTALKVEWDAIRGKPSSIFPYRHEQPAWQGKLDVLSVNVDFVF